MALTWRGSEPERERERERVGDLSSIHSVNQSVRPSVPQSFILGHSEYETQIEKRRLQKTERI